MIRFVFGGLITAAAGAIGKQWGPTVAGLFLAFPAIFPASATLVQKHQHERKERQGLHGEIRGKDAAADDALGAAMGSIGLLAFAMVGWWLIPRGSPGFVLAVATLVWFLAASTIWILRKRGWRPHKPVSMRPPTTAG
jgi:hypothetical protein